MFRTVGEIVFLTPDWEENNPLRPGLGIFEDAGGRFWFVIGRAGDVAADAVRGVVFARQMGTEGDYRPYTAQVVRKH